MDTRKFIQDIIDNELTMCFADCSQDNIDKWVEILERYKKQLNIHSVSNSYSKEDLRVAFEQARCNKHSFDDWYDFNCG